MEQEITVALARGDDKKNSVVFKGESDSGFRYSLYIGNEDLRTLGNPNSISLTVAAT